MSRHSLFFKLFLGNLLLVLLIIATGGIISHRSLEADHRSNQHEHQQQLTHMSQVLFQRLWPTISDEPVTIDRTCKTWRELADQPVRLTVIASDGVVLGDSSAMPAARMENHRTPSRPEVLAALEGREGSDIRFSDTLGREFRYMASPIRHGGRVVGAVRIAMPPWALVESRGMILRSLLLAAGASVLAAVVLGLLISWVWYVPLRQLALTARSIASGNLKQKARSVGSVELAQLADALNDMRESLAHQIETIAAQRANLQTVVVNMREGLIVTDTAEEIVLINRQAAEILDVTEAEAVGNHIQRCVRVPDMIDLYRQCRETDILVSRQLEIEVNGRMRTLQVTASPVRQGPSQGLGTLMVLHDVTDITRAAATKAEFVVNASHELRTPLAVIRAAVESLTDSDRDDEETFDKCTRMLDRHVNRLEQVTMDLLDLHAVESAGRSPLQVEPIAPEELGEWVEVQFAGQADKKGVTLDVTVDTSGGGDFHSDHKLLEMILQNLVGNALKFTPSGGQVACEMTFDGRELTVRVADTGCGIKSDDQPRVFERFFQADRARTGDTAVRGSGLGLAIVKHAAERLRASVELESKVGRGTTITVVVPNRRRTGPQTERAEEG